MNGLILVQTYLDGEVGPETDWNVAKSPKSPFALVPVKKSGIKNM